MNLKKRLLKNCSLYIILDKENCGTKGILNIVREIKKEACIIQYRDKLSKKEEILKTALILKKILQKTNTLFIVNDYIDVAGLVESDGVHLGQNDISIENARRVLGKNKIIGLSCHSVTQAREAQKRGADYIGIGPVFVTPTKPEYPAIGLGPLKKLKKYIKIPYFAIGGIDKDTIGRIAVSGAGRAAVSRAVCKAKNAAAAMRDLSEKLKNHRDY